MFNRSFEPFPQSEIAGAIVVNVFAILSTFALVSVAVRVICLNIRQKLSPHSAKPQELVFFNTQLGYYATCLLIGNGFTDIAGLIGLRWLVEKGITKGMLCSAQAFLMQTGTWSTAFFTVSLAVHTFGSLVLRKRQSVLVAALTIAVGWIGSFLLAAAPFIHPQAYRFGPAYGPDDLSCQVRSVYPKTQFFFHLFPIFVTSVLSVILYSVIFLVLRGTLNIQGGIKLTLDPDERWTVGTNAENYHRFVARIARSMLWYPVSYISLLIPYSVVRLLSISGFSVNFGTFLFASICWFMLGVCNVLILYNIFRVLGAGFSSPSQRESGLSFGPGGKFERLTPYWSKEQQSDFTEKVAQYRYPAPLHQSPDSESTNEHSPQTSLRSLLLVNQEREASVPSFYSYPSSPSVGRAITSPTDRTSLSPSPTRPPRQGSLDSIEYPASPPRAHMYKSSTESIIVPVRNVQGVRAPGNTTLAKQPSTSTFGKRGSFGSRESTGSTISSDYSSSNGFIGGGSSPSPTHPQPLLLSAIKPTFGASGSPELPHPIPSLLHSRSLSPAAPTSRQRPVLGVMHSDSSGLGRTGSSPSPRF